MTATLKNGGTRTATVTNIFSSPTGTDVAISVDGADRSDLRLNATHATGAVPLQITLGRRLR